MKKTQILTLALLIIFGPCKYAAASTILDCLSIQPELKEKKGLIALVESIKDLSPEFQLLIKEIKTYYPENISVVLTDETEKESYWTRKQGTIYISKILFDNPFKFASALVFEMCNATNKHFFDYSIEKISNSFDSYALFAESCEYETMKRRHKISVEFLFNGKETAAGKELQKQLQEDLKISNKKERVWNPKWSLNLNISQESPFEIDAEPPESFYSVWEYQNIKRYNNETVSHSDLYRIEFRKNRDYYLTEQREPQGAEWKFVCLAIETLSFQWQITADRLLSIEMNQEPEK